MDQHPLTRLQARNIEERLPLDGRCNRCGIAEFPLHDRQPQVRHRELGRMTSIRDHLVALGKGLLREQLASGAKNRQSHEISCID
jgi:hypothetical protein